ncbi:PREDICTED: laccase-4-like [Dufourea novaeangliae]|uniref:laccase-4-like n=1 Tax=Dufourea novaeangliae TaxID=178035 RepID=UPI000767B9FA|nr:PREDICTED: laccase-4-like [Dufourea novaeangliae]
MPRFENFLVLVVSLISLGASTSQTQDGDYHECLRPCADESSSKKLCRYEFFVSELPAVISERNCSKIVDESVIGHEGIPRNRYLGINGKSPGPRIEVCHGDTIEVLLYNRLGSEELSLHWHGLQQKGSAHMDGVPMVTQCAVLPFGGFRYKLKPESVGTYFYHAHLVSQQGDGVYGSLTVRGPQDDPSLERILLLSSRPPTPLSRYSHLHPPTPTELLLNGQSKELTLKVDHGGRYLLRLINANAYNCPVRLSISGHDFRVVAADGNVVQPVTGRHIVLFPGERYDVTIEANQPAGKYLVDMRGLQDCQKLQQTAHIFYNDAEIDSAVIKDEEPLKINDDKIAKNGYNCNERENVICSLDLKGAKGTSSDINADEIIYIPFDVNNYPSFTDEMTDNRYNFFGCAYYPSYLSTNQDGVRIAQINGMSFKYPSSPLLSQPENTPDELICSLEKRSQQCVDTPLFCECVQMIEVSPKRNVEIILIDQGFGGNASHGFHVHGYSASIVGRGSFDRPVTKEEIMYMNYDRKLHRNLVDPPQKDSFVVPNKGYVILRLFTDNLGYWLWEARSTAISPGTYGPGMQFLLKVGSRESFVPVPLNFPTCGNNKHPDMVFENN